MTKIKLAVVVSFLLCFSFAKAQSDSAFLKKYPFLIGNLAFAVDSLETPVGNLFQGTDTTIRVEIYNAGNKSIKLFGGKSNRFVDITYSAAVLQPRKSAFAKVTLRVPAEMKQGNHRFEAVFETGDELNPFKFLYFSAQILKKKKYSANDITDTVPRLIFDSYLYDFGHLRKGKTLFHTFYFSNRGKMDIFIREIIVDKDLVITEWPPKIIKPGKGGHLTVKIKARRYIGVLHKSIKIVSNDPVNPILTLGIHGTIKHIPSKQNPTDYCIE